MLKDEIDSLNQDNDDNGNAHIPIPMEFQYVPKNPYTFDGSLPGGGESNSFPGNGIDKSFWKGFKSEAYEFNFTAQGIHAGYENIFEKPNPLQENVSADWKSNNPDMLANVRYQYLPYMLQATGPRDQSYRLQRVMSEQEHDDNLANGTFMERVLGGIAGLGTDPISYIPIIGWAKYGKFAPTILNSIGRALPGVATTSVLQNAANQTDKVNGNLHDFLVNSMVETVFGTTLFGIGGAAGLAIEKMNLWNLKGIAKHYMDGVDFKLTTDAEGKLNGIKAIDTTGNLSAAKINIAQKLADSEFHKGGLFKIPYVGTPVYKVLSSTPLLGSTLLKMLDSPFDAVRGAIDRVADHGVITKGVAEGGVAPQKFSNLMNQEFAELRSIDAQITALHLEYNGYKDQGRPLNGLLNLGLNIKNATIDKLTSIQSENQFASREEFLSKVDRVLFSNESSEHAAVNEAANIIRTKRDQVYKDYRIAEGLPEDWLPPKMADGYSTRVYNTEYMNNHENDWIETVSQSYKEADAFIEQKMQPIYDLEERIKQAKEEHLILSKSKNISNEEIKASSDLIDSLKRRKQGLSDSLQNEMRSNPDWYGYVDNWHDLSADESKQLKQLLAPITKIKKEIKVAKRKVEALNKETFFTAERVNKAKTAKTAKQTANVHEENKKNVEAATSRLKELQDKLFLMEEKLQERIEAKEINPRFYNKIEGSQRYAIKKPTQRLKFRSTLNNDAERKQLAKFQYNAIMNQTPEETINQVLGGYLSKGGAPVDSSLSRTVMVPDEVLYNNKFMSPDLMAKFSNYVTFFARRTHLKNTFGDLSEDGGIQPLLENLHGQHEEFRETLNKRIAILEKDLKEKEFTDKEKKKINKQIDSARKELNKKRVQFETGKKQLNYLYNKMMGNSAYSYTARKWQRGVMAFTALANLPFVPFTMINDLSNIPFKSGLTSFIRDAIYPFIESFGGVLKTKDSEAFRKAAPSIHLALQDVTTGYADRNWSMQTNPYVNMGKIVNSLEWAAHANSNFTLTNYFDNYLQRMAASAHQSEIMRILHANEAGKMTPKESLQLRKYGLDPKEWSERMVKAFKKAGGVKNKLGGYQSRFWSWDDMEAANKFGDTLFRAVKDTIIQRDIADAPMWADNPIGALLFGFQGWTFASLNRFVVPSMQEPDARKLTGILLSIVTGALVDPMRRMARGEDAFPSNQSNEKFMVNALQNSGYFSYFNMILSDMNVLTGDRLLGNLRNDRYKDRTRIGLLGPAFGTFNRMFDVITALGSGEMNKADARKMARMMPFANATWTYWLTNKLVEGLDIPETRAQAHAMKQWQ